MTQKRLCEFTLKDALDYKTKLQVEINKLEELVIYWSGVCDLLKDKESQEQEVKTKSEQDKK